MICTHCGAPVRRMTLHARLSAGPREAHDRKVRESELAVASYRACYDRDYSFDVIRRAAAARGNAFP